MPHLLASSLLYSGRHNDTRWQEISFECNVSRMVFLSPVLSFLCFKDGFLTTRPPRHPSFADQHGKLQWSRSTNWKVLFPFGKIFTYKKFIRRNWLLTPHSHPSNHLNETLHLQNPPRSPLLSPCRALPLVGFLKITEFTFQSSALSKSIPLPKKSRNIASCFKGGQWEWSGSWKNSRKKRQPGIKIFKFNKHRGSSSSPPSSPCQECQQPGSSVPVSPSRRRCSTSWTSSQSSHALDLIQWKRICVQTNIYELLGLAQRCNRIIFLNNWF